MKRLFSLIVGVSTVLLTGCIHNQGLNVKKIAGRDAKVVPVRTQPITVMSENITLVVVGTLAGGLGGGLAANAATQGATAKKRMTLAERLNAEAGEFKPETILAEECMKWLEGSQKARFRTLQAHVEPMDLPGRDQLIQGETQPFKTKNPNAFDWHLRARDWLRTPPSPEYARATGEGRSIITIEVLFPVIRLINAKTFEMDVAIRVVDSSENKIVGSRYTMVRKKIRPITGDSSFAAFEEDFRRCASEASRECLKQLKLL